jgi:hypothetical protein
MHLTVWRYVSLLAGIFHLLSGCGFGPNTVSRDRFDYTTAISESWKQQILLNLVKTRYADAPVFLEVTSVINQYGIEGALSAGTLLHAPSWYHEDEISGVGRYYDRPTITYTPLTRDRFARSMMSPIPPAVILSFIQSGWPADFILRLTCDTINGVRNRSNAPLNPHAEDPAFVELIDALRRIQTLDTISLRVEQLDKREIARVVLGSGLTSETAQDRATVRRILNLDPQAKELNLVFGPVGEDNKELAILSRSMLQILAELASFVEVPEDHVTQGQTYASPAVQEGSPRLIRIQSGQRKPKNAFATTHYNGCWFWINKTDFASKRMLSVLILLFSLSETDVGAGAPVVTISAGG